MKRSTLVFTTLIICFQITMDAIAQKKNATTTGINSNMIVPTDYVPQLLYEINSLNSKIERLRIEWKLEAPDQQEKILAEMLVLENKVNKKQIEASEINYYVNLDLYDQKKSLINILVKKTTLKANKSHIEYLLNDAAKNHKQALQLAAESKSQSNLVFALGSLENAQEKILMSLQQQQEVIDLLETSSSKTVAKK